MIPMELIENAGPAMNFGYIQKTWIDKHLSVVAKKYNFKRSDLSLLYLLRINKDIHTAKDIVKYSDLKRGNISLIVETLTCKGYIKQSAIEGDRRMRKLDLTPKCQSIIEDCDEIVNKLLKIALSGITETEIETLKTCFKKMYSNMENADSKNSEDK